MDMFRKYNGNVPTEARKRAQKETGLTGQQINKWIHDQKMRERKDLEDRVGISMDQT